jgi:hypothetical protein
MLVKLVLTWISQHLGYVVLTAFIASLGSLVYSVIQIWMKKKLGPSEAQLPEVPSEAPVAPLIQVPSGVHFEASTQTLQVDLVNALSAGTAISPTAPRTAPQRFFAQQISGQGQAEGQENIMKGLYGTGGYSTS